MKYQMERDLYLSKVENTINEKYGKGYKLHSMVVTETGESETRNGQKTMVANKATLIFEKMD